MSTTSTQKYESIVEALNDGEYNLVDKLCLRKNVKDDPEAKMYRATALNRLRKYGEALALCDEVVMANVTDIGILKSLEKIYRFHSRWDSITRSYEAASKKSPDSIEIAKCLFTAYLCEKKFRNMQVLAMKWYKSSKSKTFLMWAVTCLVLQTPEAQKNLLDDVTTVKVCDHMNLKLAKMLMLRGLEIEKPCPPQMGETSRMLVSVLIQRGDFEEAEKVLRSKFVSTQEKEVTTDGAYAGMLSKYEIKTLLAELCILRKNWVEGKEQFERILQFSHDVMGRGSDDWRCCRGYIKVVVGLAESKENDDVLSEAIEFADLLQDMAIKCNGGRANRGPDLLKIGLVHHMCTQKKDGDRAVLLNLVRDYWTRWGSKYCCFHDLSPYLDDVRSSSNWRVVFLNALRETKIDVNEKKEDEMWGHAKREEKENEETMKSLGHEPPPLPPLPPPSSIKNTQNRLRKHICALQIVERLSENDEEKDEDMKTFRSASTLVELWRSTLYLNRRTGNKDDDEREVQQGDDLLLLAVRCLGHRNENETDVRKMWQRTIDALSILEMGLSHSSHNFTFKLYMVHLYASIGAIPRALELYESVRVKNIQTDTLAHHVGDAVFALGFTQEAKKIHGRVVGFHREVFHDTAEYASLAFNQNNVCKVHDIVEMWRKLKCSHQLYVSRSYADIMDMWHNLRDLNRYLKAAKLQSSENNVESLMEASLKELSCLRHTEDLSLCLSDAGFISFSPWRENVFKNQASPLHPLISDSEANELRLRALLPGLLLDVESSDCKSLSSRVREMQKICTPSWRIVSDAFAIMLRLLSETTKEDLNKDKSLCEMLMKIATCLNKEFKRLCSEMSLWCSGPSSCLILSQSWTFMYRSLLVISILIKTFSKQFKSSAGKKKMKKGKKKTKKSAKTVKLSFQSVSDSILALHKTCTDIATEFTKRIKKEVSNHKNGWNNDAMQQSEVVTLLPIVIEHTLRGQKKCLLNLMKEIQSFSLFLKGIK